MLWRKIGTPFWKPSIESEEAIIKTKPLAKKTVKEKRNRTSHALKKFSLQIDN